MFGLLKLGAMTEYPLQKNQRHRNLWIGISGWELRPSTIM